MDEVSAVKIHKASRDCKRNERQRSHVRIERCGTPEIVGSYSPRRWTSI